MTPVMQTKFGYGTGNCFAACLASLLDLPLEEVEHFSMGAPEWRGRLDNWLAERGQFWMQVHRDSQGNWPINLVPDQCLLIAGGSSEAGCPHAIIVRIHHTNAEHPSGPLIEFETVHDPHPKKRGLAKMEVLNFFCVLHQ